MSKTLKLLISFVIAIPLYAMAQSGGVLVDSSGKPVASGTGIPPCVGHLAPGVIAQCAEPQAAAQTAAAPAKSAPAPKAAPAVSLTKTSSIVPDTPPAPAVNNWMTSSGALRNGDGKLCWRNNYWTKDTAAKDCDGAAVPAPPAPAPAAPAPAPKAAPAPAPAPAPKAAPAPAPKPVVQRLSFNADTFFDFDKSVLKPEGKNTLDKLVSNIHGIKLEVVIAVGHTDSIGSEAYNDALSLRRAETVKSYLVNKGIDPTRIYTEGKGERQPIESNKTRAGRAKNRRVEIEVVGTK